MRPVRVVIQGRLSSSRLPAKALLPIAGLPSIVLCTRRAATSKLPVLVATSVDPSDDPLSEALKKHDIAFVRGPLKNVLSRFVQATADLSDEGIVIRLTADNVFPDGEFLQSMLRTFERSNIDYLGTRSPQDGLPYGLSAEIFSARILRAAAGNATSTMDLEHVTPWITRQCAAKVYRPEVLGDYSHLRATIDRFDDYLRVTKVFCGIDDPVHASWRVLCDRLAAIPDSPQYRVPWKERNGGIHSAMTLGTAQFGLHYGATNTTGQPSKEEAGALLRRAIDHGVTGIDCASAYGTAESVVGRALGLDSRDAAQIVTKLDPLVNHNECAGKEGAAVAAERSVYRSLHRLQRRRLDTLLLHRWQHRFDFGGAIWSALQRLQAEGKIGALGVSVYSPDDAIAALADPTIHHIQLPLNLLDWRWRSDVFLHAVHSRPDVIVHARSAFLQGLLVGPAGCWPRLEQVDPGRCVETLESLVCELGRRSRADLCIAYVRSHDWITSTVIGVETNAQLDDSMNHFLNPALTTEERAHVEKRISQAPLQLLDPSKWPATIGHS